MDHCPVYSLCLHIYLSLFPPYWTEGSLIPDFGQKETFVSFSNSFVWATVVIPYFGFSLAGP